MPWAFISQESTQSIINTPDAFLFFILILRINFNFSYDIKRRTCFDFVSIQVLFLVAEAGLEPTTSGL